MWLLCLEEGRSDFYHGWTGTKVGRSATRPTAIQHLDEVVLFSRWLLLVEGYKAGHVFTFLGKWFWGGRMGGWMGEWVGLYLILGFV